MSDEAERPAVGRTVTGALAAGAAATASAGFIGPWGAVATAVVTQAAVDLTQQVWEAIGVRRRRNAAFPLQYAASRTGLSLDDIAERLSRDSEYVALGMTVMTAGAGTDRDDKLFALGFALANSLEDAARIGEEQIIATALAVIETPHLDILDYVRRRSRETGETVYEHELRERSTAITFPLLIKSLEAVGLLASNSAFEMVDAPVTVKTRFDETREKVPRQTHPRWRLTPLGHEVMNRISAAAQEASEVSDSM